jgi:ferredoxin--NADP+ reductase
MTYQTTMTQPKAVKSAVNQDLQTVTEVTHWTDDLFSFRITRPASFRFRSGEFVMIGVMNDDGKPLVRAYSIASPSWDDTLEFYSIKVPDGPLTSRLQHISPGDQIILRPKPVGTLVHDTLLPGKRLWLFASGTGIAPFASLVREPQTYEDYDQIILTHTCRNLNELEFSQKLITGLKQVPLIDDFVGDKLVYYPTTTREDSPCMGRITTLLQQGKVFEDLNLPQITAEHDRAMVCGSMGLNTDLKSILEHYGLREGANSDPAEFVVEKAFVG